MKLINAKHTMDPYTFQPELELVISVPLEPLHDLKSANATTYEMLGRLFVTNVVDWLATH
jgi:hypothetical protein